MSPLVAGAIQPGPLAFIHVHVIDATGAPVKNDQAVIIQDGRIAALGNEQDVMIPDKAQIVDATGQYMIPGLWDMHVHLFNNAQQKPPNESFFPLMLANGVTGLREMWTKPEEMDQVRKWRSSLQGAPAPRILAAGILVDGADPVLSNSNTVANEQDARAMVRAIQAAGADFIKIYWNLSRKEYFSIADEAGKIGLPFAGHVPFSISAREASDAGQKSIEHLTDIAMNCSSKEKQLRKVPKEKWSTKQELEILDSYDKNKCRDLFSHFVRNGTWQVPTLVVFEKLILSDEALMNDDRLKYLPPWQKEEWMSFIDLRKQRTRDQILYGSRLRLMNLQIVGEMNRAGVRLIAGTDTPMSFVFPGFSLHDELALLVQAGLTPMEAIQSATRNPAEFLRRSADFGTIERGKIADLLLLDANPLEDIHNARKIHAVVLNGTLLTKDSLDRLLTTAETSAQRQP